jgi:hypothetical protein
LARGAPAVRLDDDSPRGPHQAIGGIAQTIEIPGAGIGGHCIEGFGEIRRSVHHSSAKFASENRPAIGLVRWRAFIVWT